MKIVALIQARLGSTRLPYKMMLSLHGHPVVRWVYERTKKSKKIDDVVVAIPASEDNDVLATYLQNVGANIFRGEESDVLGRFYHAAKLAKATHIVRICADNPLVCHEAIDDLVDFYFEHQCDYAYNHIPVGNNYPDGLGAEIISFELLKTMHKNAKSASQREHCMNYIRDNSELFRIKTFNPKDARIARPYMRFDIDTFEDYRKLCLAPIDLHISSTQLVQLFEGNNETTRAI